MKVIFAIILVLTLLPVSAQKDKKIVDKNITKPQIKAHINFLASDVLKGRDTGSDELKIAAEYLKNQLLLFGVKSFPEYPDYLQPVQMERKFPPNEGYIKIDSSSFALMEDFFMLSGENSTWKGDYVLLDYALKSEIDSADVAGKMIVARCGDGSSDQPRAFFRLSQQKREWADAAGAEGLIELYQSSQLPFAILLRYLGGESTALSSDEAEEEKLTHLYVNNAGNNTSKSFTDPVEKTLSLSIAGKRTEPFTSYNVVGYLEGTDRPEEYIVYSAHYDHVGVGSPDSTGDGIYNGARDNAVGTVTVLSAAENLAKYPTNRSSLFILFTGEEKGLLGSEWFVDNCPVDLQKIIYCFNSDGAGYNDTEKATIIGLTRTTAESTIRKACEAFGIEAIEDQMPEQNLFDRSDNVNFAAKGIPAPTFSMGITSFNDEIMQYYHQPGDEPETLDFVYLEKFFKSYVYSARLLSNMKEIPFWVEGDKYYQAGTELYKNK